MLHAKLDTSSTRVGAHPARDAIWIPRLALAARVPHFRQPA